MLRSPRQAVFVSILLLLLSGWARPEQHPVRTRHVLERWLQAIGGKEKLAAVRTMYAKAVIVSGGQVGMLEKWQTAQGEYKTTAMIGDHEFITVCDGRAGWSQRDSSVEDLGSNELAASITQSYLGSYSQFFPDRRPGALEWVREDPDAFVVKIVPEGGLPVTFYLDKKTGLPLKHEMVESDRIMTFFYLEWKEFGGIKTFGRGRQSSGDAAADLSVTTQDVQWNLPLDPKIFQKPVQ